jgi:hypothetical protein
MAVTEEDNMDDADKTEKEAQELDKWSRSDH